MSCRPLCQSQVARDTDKMGKTMKMDGAIFFYEELLNEVFPLFEFLLVFVEGVFRLEIGFFEFFRGAS
jgi:hypothetical protein